MSSCSYAKICCIPSKSDGKAYAGFNLLKSRAMTWALIPKDCLSSVWHHFLILLIFKLTFIT